jgi:hypothetical protein
MVYRRVAEIAGKSRLCALIEKIINSERYRIRRSLVYIHMEINSPQRRKERKVIDCFYE